MAFIDAPAKQMNKKQTLERVKKEAADAKLFVFDTSTPSIYSDVEFAGTIKNMYPDAFTMLVGTHPSATPDETMGICDLIDGLARHEYDYIVRDTAIALRDGVDLATVRGLTYRKDGEVVHNPDAEHITDLDEIPYACRIYQAQIMCDRLCFSGSSFPLYSDFHGTWLSGTVQLLRLSPDAPRSSLSPAQSGKCHR